MKKDAISSILATSGTAAIVLNVDRNCTVLGLDLKHASLEEFIGSASAQEQKLSGGGMLAARGAAP